MHGRNVTLSGGGRAVTGTESAQSTPSAAGATRIANLRNLFDPSPQQRFSAGGLVALAATDEAPFRRLMAKLAKCQESLETWPKPLASSDLALKDFENPGIPAGYTYLLQLIAHDMIDSEVSLAEAGAGRLGLANTRYEPLSLDTIYGGGPDNTPQAYEIDQVHRRARERVPRTRLRLGRIADAHGRITKDCPFRDLARALPIDVTDAGLGEGERLDWPTPDRRPWRTEVLAADVRNDSHALISQLTVLFHILHNHVLGLLGAPDGEPRATFQRFMCARMVVTMIYRNIIVEDVLRRILHPAVYDRYITQRQPLLEGAPEEPGALDPMPVEFAHGAFRFGHAMVRTFYRVNNAEAQPFGQALDLSSVHQPGALPMQHLWHVDWSLFFETGHATPNWSVRIGPQGARPLLHSYTFPALNPDLDRDGVSNRDLLSAGFADLWSVPALIAHLRTLPGVAALLPEYGVWRAPLRAWLGRHDVDFTAQEIAILVEDPPLPFFVLFEAAHTLHDGVPKGLDGGRYLGPLGSLIVAETIVGTLERFKTSHDVEGSTLQQRIAAACQALVGNGAALAQVPEIKSMPMLLEFLKNGREIDLPGPA